MSLGGGVMASRLLCGFLCVAALATSIGSAIAESWPTRPITIVAPYPAGGNHDIAARLFAKELSIKLDEPVIVENKPGGGGAVASTFVANARPDGYTVLLTGS